MVVHHVDAPPLPPNNLQEDRYWQVVRPTDPQMSWNVCTGPASWDDWTDCELFGQYNPHAELPPVRFEGEPDGDTVDVVAPVLDDDWLLRVSLRRDGDTLVPVGIELRPRPGAVINARLLRTLGFGGIHKVANTILLGHPKMAARLGDRWGQPVEQPGRAGRKDEFYADWSRRYVEALAAEPRRPIALLIEQAAERGEHVTRGEIASRLTVARQRGLLTEAPSGQAGGELTDKARHLLGITTEEIK